MRYKFLLKIVFKSLLFLTLLFLLVIQLLDNDAGEYPMVNEISGDGVTTSLTRGGNTAPDITELDELQKNVLYSKRYWDLVKMNDSNYRGSSRALIQDKLDHLWRPQKGQPGPDDSDRFVPQLVWQMEALNSSFGSKLKPKKILIWDSFRWWSKRDWTGPKELTDAHCPKTPNSIKDCIFTENHSDIDSVDAVVATRDMFHIGEVSVPKKVLKFYFILESPFHSWAFLNRSEDLLATYYRGSDLLTPYAKWVYYDPSVTSRVSDTDYAKGKTKSIAVFVSNCDAWNNRMGYINELKKYVKVDVYGNCGELQCSKFNDECFEMLRKDYFFYLAFENSNCRDYITEKLFSNALANNVVPVVMGAHPEDYQALAPHKSYISIEDYTSPKELAEYLIHLMKNPSKYNEYFQWKGTGQFISSDFFCRLCAMVHYADFIAPPKRTRGFRWGHVQAIKSGMCLPKNQWYWNKPKQSTENWSQGELNDIKEFNSLYGIDKDNN